jgi:hypothetical protein
MPMLMKRHGYSGKNQKRRKSLSLPILEIRMKLNKPFKVALLVLVRSYIDLSDVSGVIIAASNLENDILIESAKPLNNIAATTMRRADIL